MNEGGLRLTGQLRETRPKLSIICVTYNASTCLEGLLASISRLNLVNYEVIIADGGSTDGTIDLLEKNSDRISYWRAEPDEGIYDAMNKAVKWAKGTWIYFIGADDELLSDFSKMVNQLQKDKTVYYANVLFKGKKEKGPFNDFKLAKKTIHHQCIFYPKTVFDQYEYNPIYRIGADYVLNIECWAGGKFDFEYRDLIVARYNDTGVSSCQEDVQLLADKDRIIYKNFSKPVYWLWRLRKALYSFKKKKLG